MVGSVQGAAQQPFSVLYKPGSSAGQDSAKDVRQNDRQQTRTTESGSAEESREVQKTESRSESSSSASTRYAAYDRDDSGSVRASGDDQRRGSVVNITV